MRRTAPPVLTACAAWLLLALLSGCAPWQRVTEPGFVGPDDAYTVRLPVGWVRLAAARDRVIVTRDGLALQRIEIFRREHAEAFPRIEAAAAEDMLPNELAALAIAELQAEPGVTALEVLENRPATIDGHDGFRVRTAFANQRGLRYELVVYGFADARGYAQLSYLAPRLHYFERDLGTFEETVASFRTRAG